MPMPLSQLTVAGVTDSPVVAGAAVLVGSEVGVGGRVGSGVGVCGT